MYERVYVSVINLLAVIMVLTKAEQQQLTDLRDQYVDLKELIEKVGGNIEFSISAKLNVMDAKLTGKIEDVERNLSADFKRLSAEITQLKETDARIEDSLNRHRESTSKVIQSLQTNIDETKSSIEDESRELQAANMLISSQAAKIVSLEKQCHKGLQHGRGWNIEIDGIPKEVGDDPPDLQSAFVSLCETFNIEVCDDYIETIHRLPSKHQPKPVIIRFFSRETVREVHQKKNRLQNLHERYTEVEMAGINASTKIYIRPSQCAYYKNLAFNCRLLKRNNLISKVTTSNDGRISIKLLDESNVKIAHESTLVNLFPDFSGFNFVYDKE